MGKRTLSEMAGEVNYADWTKDELIKKIKNLERKRQPTPKKIQKEFDFLKHNKRLIAVRFGYLGWNYNGLAYQQEPTPLPTVEGTILKALHLAKLIPSPDPDNCKFSRCGRTDKGVSAMNQVISLNVRSNLTDEEQLDPKNDAKELGYISILNSLIPSDIRVTAVCLRPPTGFDARFSCLYRHYRYYFKGTDLDIDLMNIGASKYLGGHDFRNFCKIDGSKQITNYNRAVHSAKIVHFKDDFYYLDLKGSAFLWHQVRCMTAILFLIGQKLEDPTIIDKLLDVKALPSKPNFEMADDIPLVLYDCVFPEMEWLKPTYFPKHKMVRDVSLFQETFLDYQIKANHCKLLEGFYVDQFKIPESTFTGGAINVGNGKGRFYKTYIPILSRPVGETFQVVNSRHKEKQKMKKIEQREEGKAQNGGK